MKYGDNNTAFMRDLATQLSALQRPTNSEFWRNPKFGQSEWAANQLFAELVERTIVISEPIPVAG